MQRRETTDGFGSDSFLDIVANIVGILIILVMVVGVRVKHSPGQEDQPPEENLPDVAATQAEINLLESDLAKLKNGVAAVNQSWSQRQNELREAAAELQAAKVDVDAQYQESAQSMTSATDAQQKVAASQRTLQLLRSEIEQTKDVKPEVVKIESFATPISKTVQGDEAHFQLLGGRIAYVPFHELVEKSGRDARANLKQLRYSSGVTAVVGPLRGFRLRYTIQRLDASADREYTRMAGLQAQMTLITFIPESQVLGETLDEALQNNSDLRLVLGSLDPRSATITLWTYPDSYAQYRRLRKELYLLGFSVAARPLPFGQLIGASPSGSRSSAQ